MRSSWRTLGPDLGRQLALVCLAAGLVGVSFGAITVSAGLPVWLPIVMSLLVFAGAAQFVFVGLIAAGGSAVAAVIAGLLINARHVPFGFVVGDLTGPGWLRRIVGSHLMIDEAVAFALAQDDPRCRRAVYWASGAGLFATWNVSVLLGAFAGTRIADTDALGLDAAFPAVLLALILPTLRDPAVRRAALVGTAIAVAAAPVLQAGVPVLVALVGMVTLGVARPVAPRPGGGDAR